jgi:membrane fusion protein YbhG
MQRKVRVIVGVTILSAVGGFIAHRALASDHGGEAIFVSGTVEATEAELGFQLSGRLAKVEAREGDQVAPGTQLAVLDQAELLAEREVARAQVAAAGAVLAEYLAGSRSEEIARAKAMLVVAIERRDGSRRDVERMRPLAQQAVISRQSFDHEQTNLEVDEGEVARATEELRLLEAGTRPERIAAQRAALAQARASLERINAQIAQSTVTAPFAGTVTIRHREPGEAVAPGSAVLTLQNLDDRWVRTYVPGDEVGRLSLGQCASIASDGFADRSYAGKISYIARVAEFTPRNVQSTKDRVRLVYEVRVRIVGDDQVDLKPGLPGDVTFSPATAAGCGPTVAVN